jgi:ferredoxin
MLRKLRIILAVTVFSLVTLLFLDFTGTLHLWFGWLAKMQLIPAILAVNIVALIFIVLLTIIFGRVYCSVICPLGIMQDGISNIAGRRKKNRFSYSKAKGWLRYSLLALFLVALVAHISVISTLLDPYAAYGRIASNLLSPIYRLGNNLFAFFAERVDSYAFYSTEIWIKSCIVFGVAIATLVTIGILAWRNGRTYCNTICPVGSLLGNISEYSINTFLGLNLFRITFDADKCTDCELCERNCKASCINSKEHKIDYSRCVSCFNCVEKCKTGAINYKLRPFGKKKNVEPAAVSAGNNNDGLSRRSVLSLLGLFAAGQALRAQEQAPVLTGDGGLTLLEDKIAPARQTPIAPPGAESLKNMKIHCTACQLCVSACPNNVLRPSKNPKTFMQPEMSFEKGYCRPECIECSSVCPTGAIKSITEAQKSVIAVGSAIFIEQNCIVLKDKEQCNVCEVKCAPNAIVMRKLEPEKDDSLKVPAIDKEKCTGCGACEYLCPARPFSALYVEGNVRHHEVW